jgi:3-methyl-2-oxobutanoate hydroxymethyltransferase
MKNNIKKLTVCDFRKKKENNKKITALTAYDAPIARFAEESNIDMILIGDSLGMAVLGYENTIPVTIEESLHHCKAVRRGAPSTFC